MKHLGILFPVSTCLLMCAVDASANLMLRRPASDTTTFGLQLSRPIIHDWGYKGLTGSLQFDVRVPVTHSVAFTTQLPIANSDKKYESDDGTVLGNIGIGLDFLLARSEKRQTSATLMAQLPTAAQYSNYGPEWYWPYDDGKYYALFAGNAADLYDVARFNSGYWSLYGNFSQQFTFDSCRFGFELGPTILLGRDERDSEAILHYGVSGGIGSRRLLLTLELSGLWLMTKDGNESSDGIDHFAAVGFEFPRFVGRPIVYFQKPLDSEYDDVSGAVQLKLEFPIGNARP